MDDLVKNEKEETCIWDFVLCYSGQGHNIAILDLLLKSGLDIHHTDSTGHTVLSNLFHLSHVGHAIHYESFSLHKIQERTVVENVDSKRI